jgi:hypothetical protein
MRTRTAIIVVALIVGVGVAAQTPAPAAPGAPPQVDKPFAPGGSIYMDLSAGGYVIEGTPDPRIRIRWSTKDADAAKSVRATADVTGTEARVTTAGPSNGFNVRIEVPLRTNVSISLSAGDLALGALDGDVDLSAWAGNMRVAVRNPSEYYSVRASVTAGQISAEPFQVNKGGLFRSFSWDGKGRRALRVRLTAGDVVLTQSASGHDGR